MSHADHATHTNLSVEDIEDVYDRISKTSATTLGETYVELQAVSILNGTIDIAPSATITTNNTSAKVTEP